MLKYAGIGSRETPKDIILLMMVIAEAMAPRYVLRSGGADGADLAFEHGCNAVGGKKEIYLPEPNFNNSSSTLHHITDDMMKMAESYHPAWSDLPKKFRLLHARNCCQVLGPHLDDPSSIVICWTPDGCETRQQRNRKTGGTGQAIAIAHGHNIPVFNLQKTESQDRLYWHLRDNGVHVPMLQQYTKESQLGLF